MPFPHPKIAALGLALAATGALATSPAAAGRFDHHSDMSCHDYAESALFQQEQNHDLACGFSGGRWSSSYDFHFTRCVRGDVDRDHEYAARREALATCVAASGPTPRRTEPLVISERCEDFARYSVKLYRKSLQLACGFHDEEWHGDHAEHARYCADGREPYYKDILKGRKVMLKRCQQGYRRY